MTKFNIGTSALRCFDSLSDIIVSYCQLKLFKLISQSTIEVLFAVGGDVAIRHARQREIFSIFFLRLL